MCKFDRTAKFVHAAQQGLTLGLASLEHPGKSLAFLSSFRRLHAFLWVSSFHQFINYWMKRADASLAGTGCLLRWMRCTCTPIKWVGMRCAKRIHEMCHDVPRNPCLGFLGNCLQKSAANEFLWWTMTWRAPAAWRRCKTCKCNQCNNRRSNMQTWDIVGRGMLLDLLWPFCVFVDTQAIKITCSNATRWARQRPPVWSMEFCNKIWIDPNRSRWVRLFRRSIWRVESWSAATSVHVLDSAAAVVVAPFLALSQLFRRWFSVRPPTGQWMCSDLYLMPYAFTKLLDSRWF